MIGLRRHSSLEEEEEAVEEAGGESDELPDTERTMIPRETVMTVVMRITRRCCIIVLSSFFFSQISSDQERFLIIRWSGFRNDDDYESNECNVTLTWSSFSGKDGRDNERPVLSSHSWYTDDNKFWLLWSHWPWKGKKSCSNESCHVFFPLGSNVGKKIKINELTSQLGPARVYSNPWLWPLSQQGIVH